MKRLFALFALATLWVALFPSCKKEKEPDYGIVSLKLITGGGDTYNFVVDQATLTANNEANPIPTITQGIELKNCTFQCVPTLEATVLYKGADLNTATFDLTALSTFDITVQQGKWEKIYKVTVMKGEVGGNLSKGIRISADMTAGGFPVNTIYYDINYFNGRFIAFATTYVPTTDNEGTEKHLVYTSTNAKKWTKVAENVGAVGCKSVIYNGKLCLYGGMRAFGKDEDGNKPDADGNVKKQYLWTTTDGEHFTDESGNLTYDEDVAVYVNGGYCGFAFNDYGVLGNKITYHAGRYTVFGMFQAGSVALSSNDGKHWAINKSAGKYAMTRDGAFVAFQNALWYVGGYTNYISANNIPGTIYKTSDCVTWDTVTEACDAVRVFGPTVVTNKAGTAMYLFGGEFLTEDGTHVLSNLVYKTANGKDWTPVSIDENYPGRRNPCVVVDDNNIAWIFGRETQAPGFFTYTLNVSDYAPTFDVWALQLEN